MLDDLSRVYFRSLVTGKTWDADVVDDSQSLTATLNYTPENDGVASDHIIVKYAPPQPLVDGEEPNRPNRTYSAPVSVSID